MVVLTGNISSLSGVHVARADSSELNGDDESTESVTNSSFYSKIYLLWDPEKVSGGNLLVLEIYSGLHAVLQSRKISSWKVDGAKDVIGSIGGVQCLLPLFRYFLSKGHIERGWEKDVGDGVCAMNIIRKERSEIFFLIEYCQSSLIIPSLFNLLVSFLRDHHENSREFLRYGGVDIVEPTLSENNFFLRIRNPKRNQ